MAGEAVRVSDGQCGKGARGVRRIGRAVADVFPGRQRVDVSDRRFQPHHRTEQIVVAHHTVRRQAVEHDPGAHRIQIRLRERENPRTVCRVPQPRLHTALLQPVEHLAVARPLEIRQRRTVRLRFAVHFLVVTAGKVGKQSGQAQVRIL